MSAYTKLLPRSQYVLLLITLACTRSTADPSRAQTIAISPSNLVLIVGDTAQAAMSASDEGAVTWTVEDTAIAEATANGEVHGRRPGRTRLIADRNGISAYASLRVFRDSLPDLYVIAHRGFAGVFPENTLVAVNNAFDIGADAVEVDVAMSKDRVPMLMHDSTVDRTTNGQGPIAQMTSDELRQLDACSKFNTRWGPCPVPTAREALRAAHGRGRILLHLKGPWPTGALDTLLAMVRQERMRRDVVFIDFTSTTLAYVQSRDSLLAVGLLGAPSVINTAPSLRRFARLLFEGNLDTLAAAVQDFRRRALTDGGAVGAWTIRSTTRATTLRGLGIGWMITDVPLDTTALSAISAP
jgi:glycerophosphoryl diester phosphodiesterase